MDANGTMPHHGRSSSSSNMAPRRAAPRLPTLRVQATAPTMPTRCPPLSSDAVTPSNSTIKPNASLPLVSTLDAGSLTPLGASKVHANGPVHASDGKRKKSKPKSKSKSKKTTENGKVKSTKISPKRAKTSKPKQDEAMEVTEDNKASAGEVTPVSAGWKPAPTSPRPRPRASTLTTTETSTRPIQAQATTEQVQDQTNSAPTATTTGTVELPTQDPELRRSCLFRVYRHLRAANGSTDEAMLGRLAANLEMQVCRRATSKTEYLELLNQEINRLMQVEMSSSSATPFFYQGETSNPSPNVSAPPSSSIATQLGSPTHPAASPGNISSTVETPQPFQATASLVSMPQRQDQPQLRQTQPQMSMPYPSSTNSINASTSTVPPPGMMSYHDVAAQLQRSSKQSLIELVCNQQRAVVALQYRVAQLESYLGVSMCSPAATSPASSSFASTGLCGSPRMVTVTEREVQQQCDKMSATTSQAQSFGTPNALSQSMPSTNEAAPLQPTNHQEVINPALYWERVRFLREHYMRALYFASQAMEHHPPPPNSSQTVKYENIKHNITLAMHVLSEVPRPLQPRRIEVLDSIERFIVSMVLPIARKFQAQVQAQMQVPPQSQNMESTSSPLNNEAGNTNTATVIPDASNEVVIPTPPRKRGSTSSNQSSLYDHEQEDVPRTSGDTSSPVLATPTYSTADSVFSSNGSSMRDLPQPMSTPSVPPPPQPTEDAGMNDLDDFPDLIFPNRLQDNFTSNSNSTTVRNPKKRSIDDVV